MSCSDRRNKILRDIKRVEILAQKTADLLNVTQIIYKVTCDGVQIYKFSHDWPGEAVKIVRPSRQNTSESVLPSDEHTESEFAKPTKPKSKKRKVRRDLE